MARSQPESAVVAFRSAVTSETEGFARVDVGLARALLALGRARDAIPVLQHPLAGSLAPRRIVNALCEYKQPIWMSR